VPTLREVDFGSSRIEVNDVRDLERVGPGYGATLEPELA
jgi:hypothetical protein